MTTSDSAFVGSIPEIYERLLVPMIFDEPARHTAAEVLSSRPIDILETAAGTGVLTRALVEAGAPSVTATDLNEPMLDMARLLCPSSAVQWQVADALDLPQPDHTFDVVVCQFGVMFFPDRPRGYAEARRVLRPGGAFCFTAWNQIEANPAWCVVSDSLNAASPAEPIRFLRQTPYSYYDTDRIEAELRSGGFTDVRVEIVTGLSDSTALDTAAAVCQGTPLRIELESHPVLGVEQATQIAATALRERFGDGRFQAPISWLYVTARSSV